MKKLNLYQLRQTKGGSDGGIAISMPWELIYDGFYELGENFAHWWNGTYSGSRN